MSTTDRFDVDIDKLASAKAYLDETTYLLIGQLWQRQTVVLIFLRHFACIACRAHALQVWQQRAKFEQAGVKLVFIGHGQVSWMKHFCKDLGIHQGVVLTDPSRESFAAAGMKRGFFNLVHPNSVINSIKLSQAGYSGAKYDSDAGDHFQMGGVLAVNKRSKVLFHFVSKNLGQLPKESYLELINAQSETAL